MIELNEAALERAIRSYDVARATCLREDGESLMNAVERRARVAISAAITAYLEALPVPVDEAACNEFMNASTSVTAAQAERMVTDLMERVAINVTNNANDFMIEEERRLKAGVLNLIAADAIAPATCPPRYIVVRRDDLRTLMTGAMTTGEWRPKPDEYAAFDRLRAALEEQP